MFEKKGIAWPDSYSNSLPLDRDENTKFLFYADIYSKTIYLNQRNITSPGLNLNPFIKMKNGHKFKKEERRLICENDLFKAA